MRPLSHGAHHTALGKVVNGRSLYQCGIAGAHERLQSPFIWNSSIAHSRMCCCRMHARVGAGIRVSSLRLAALRSSAQAAADFVCKRRSHCAAAMQTMPGALHGAVGLCRS